MELIDRDACKQELEKAINRNLRMTGRPHPGVLMALQYAIARLEKAPVVDAIPVEWLSKLADECAKCEDPYVQINGLLINVVINRWEQRIEETDG